jgi:uncharacterized protein (DUF1684 family)
MPLTEWAKFVTLRVQEFIPDVRGVSRDGGIVWTYGQRTATLTVAGQDWWLKIQSSTGGKGTGLSTHSDRHDEHTSEVTAANIVIHFDSRLSRACRQTV